MKTQAKPRTPAPANLLVFNAWAEAIALVVGILSAIVGLIDDILNLGPDED